MGIKVDIVDADDWQGLYINDKLVHEDSSISARTVLGFVNYEIVECCEWIEADLDWLEGCSGLPKKLSKVQRYGENDPEHKDFKYSPIIE